MTVTLLNSAVPNTRPNIAELASESIIIFDRDGIVQYWNPAAEAAFGWPSPSMIDRNISKISVKAKNSIDNWDLLLQEGTWEGIVHRHKPDGEIVAVHVRQFVRFHSDGIVRDVIEYGYRLHTNDGLTKTNYNAPDRMTAAYWEIDISDAQPIITAMSGQRDISVLAQPDDLYLQLVQASQIIDVNDRTARLVGGHRGRELMIGQSVATFWPIDSRAILGKLIAEAAIADTVHMPHQRQFASDGILREPLVTVWRNFESGQQNRIFITVNGAADDDRSYLYLRASEARYRKLIHYMPVALWQIDASVMGKLYINLRSKGVIDFEQYLEDHPELVEFAANTVPVTDANRSAVQLFGGNSAFDLVRPVGYLFKASPETLRRVMIGRFSGRQNYSEFMKVKTLDGRQLDVRFSVTYPASPTIDLDATIFSLEDVTDRLRMEAELRQLQADFNQAARISSLGELTSSIAHEVNQPLAAIVTNAETSLRWLEQPEPNIAKVKQLANRVAASARRANEIVQRIRSMAGKHETEHVQLDLNEVAQEALLFIRHEVDSRSISVATDYTKGLPPIIGDRIQIQQVMMNLLINSVQALDAEDEFERRVIIKTGLDKNGAVYFNLRDTGSGIPQENLERVFDGFFTTKEGGMGLGLAICQSIAVAHGGRMTAANCPEGGAEFRFTVPSKASGSITDSAA